MELKLNHVETEIETDAENYYVEFNSSWYFEKGSCLPKLNDIVDLVVWDEEKEVINEIKGFCLLSDEEYKILYEKIRKIALYYDDVEIA